MATTANRIVKRNESDHGCVGGGGTVANIGAGEYSLLDIMYDTIKLIPQSYKTFATTLSLILSARMPTAIHRPHVHDRVAFKFCSLCSRDTTRQPWNS
jgi:hypothetical protein